ncbi:tRNA (32-2'-O)-methyltransferase regulator THADA [Onthophagus taurus]|uniref:tRNA (32-2'-O)-methyltransferase regulator THADA n=1 Tax=Onthophagus taurus TaxID=166361 RepID=UPI000C20D990|nr:thyroid adenoma-associated protein homolog [Onthophagus taurus]
MKPKRGPGGDGANSPPIYIPNTFESKDVRLQETIQELRKSTKIESLQQVLKELPLDDLKPADVYLAACLLTYLFLTVDSKHPIRKTISRMLSTQLNVELVKIAMSWNINTLMVACIKDTDSCQKHNELVLGLQHCFANFPLGIEAISHTIKTVTGFMIDYFSKLVLRLSDKSKRFETQNYINNVTKLLVAILQQCQLSDDLPNYCKTLMLSSYEVIKDDYINFDTKSNCGVLMVIGVIHIPEKTSDGIETTNPCLSFLKPENDVTSAFNSKKLPKNHTTNLYFYSGILNVLPQSILCEETIDGVPVISFMFGELLDTAKRCTGKSTQILEVSRSLILISKVINTIPLGYIEPMFSEALEYVWTHLDHYIDTVRQSARTIFENLIRLAHEHYKKGYQTLLKLILTNMIDLLVNRCTHYVTLTILSTETGCSFLLEQFSHLPFILLINMQNSAVAPQICNTYEILMAQHKSEERDVDKWLELWVDLIKPLLTKAKGVLVTFYQRLLVSAYKIEPMVLKSIMHYQWYSGSNELGALLRCLRTSRQNGLKIPNTLFNNSQEKIDKKYWRNIVEYEFLELMMVHQNDEIRIHVLGLIVESQKSREVFSLWELAFLKKFFHYNVTTQSPSIRQQLIGLYKKVFIRIRDTLSVLNRNLNNLTTKIENFNRNENTTDVDLNENRKMNFLKELEILKEQDVDTRQFFMLMFQKYLCPGFQTGFNYQRRSVCLELVLFVITEKCVEEEEIRKLWKPEFTQFLIELLEDSYETNIKMAFLILKKMEFPIKEHFNKKSGLLFLRQTIQNASSLKPDKVTAAGYMLQLYLMVPFAKETLIELYRRPETEDLYAMAMKVFLNRASMATSLAKTDLFRSVRDEAFYGDLMCVRNILENNDLSNCKQWTSLAHQIVETCRKIGEVVAPIVNNNSPEGYIPNKPQDNHQKAENNQDQQAKRKKPSPQQNVSPQMILVYAWRSIKEVSLLLGELTLRAPLIDPITNEEVLSDELLLKIEDYFIQVFRETKHRGAYEQASVGFSRFCEFLWRQPSWSPYSNWPKKYLDDIFVVLRGEDQLVLHKLCPNRRSAGLPFMVVDILVTEPKGSNNETFHYCIKTLLKITRDENEEKFELNEKSEESSLIPTSSSLSKIHAMNILKSLYRHHLLGEIVTTYIAEGVQVALKAFGSDKWGVRNSAFILIASLMQRIFGVQRSKELEINHKNKMSTKVFFMRYPELYECFLGYLKDGTVNNRNVTVLHPVLLILERLYPCNTEEETQLGKYIEYVTKCLQSPVYNIRELAAQASASLIPNLEVVDYVKKLLIKLSDVTLSDNYCQGTISQIICLLRSLNKGHSQLNVPEIIEGTFWIPISAGRLTSHFTVANYYDMLTLLTTVFIKNCQGAHIFTQFVKILIYQSITENNPDNLNNHRHSTARKKLSVARLNLHAHIVQNLYISDHYFKSLYLKELILSGLTSSKEEIVEYCFNYIGYLYFDHPKYFLNSLYETETIEIAEREKNLIKLMDLGLKEYVLESFHKSFHFFYAKIKRRMLKNHDLVRSMLLALQNYPCLMEKLKRTRAEVLEFLLGFCDLEEKVELFTPALGCVSNFLANLSLDELKSLNLSMVYKCLAYGVSETSPSHLKIAVARFFVANRRIFMEKEFFRNNYDVIHLWEMVMFLLDDDDEDVRNAMSELAPKVHGLRDTSGSQQIYLRFDSDLPIISEKAKDEILECCTNILPPKISIPLFISWILSNSRQQSHQLLFTNKIHTNLQQLNLQPNNHQQQNYFPSNLHQNLFQTGFFPSSQPTPNQIKTKELLVFSPNPTTNCSSSNGYNEPHQFQKMTLNHFKKLLWRLEDGLNYEDRTIFIEEHVQMVATVLYNILYHHLPPTVNPSARVTLLCVVKKVKEFAEKAGINCKNAGGGGFMGDMRSVILKEFANLGAKGGGGSNGVGWLQEIAMGIFNLE